MTDRKMTDRKKRHEDAEQAERIDAPFTLREGLLAQPDDMWKHPRGSRVLLPLGPGDKRRKVAGGRFTTKRNRRKPKAA